MAVAASRCCHDVPLSRSIVFAAALGVSLQKQLPTGQTVQVEY
jgi:hypothetical protein